jgi:hypothetical protein
MQAAKQTAEGIANVRLAAQDIANSRDAREAGAKAFTLWKHAESGTAVLAIARILVRMGGAICACDIFPGHAPLIDPGGQSSVNLSKFSSILILHT